MKPLFLKTIQGLLHAKNRDEEIYYVKELKTDYQALLGSELSDVPSQTQINTEHGLAISPQHAIDCLDDYLRTSRFLKGTYAALKDLTARSEGKTLEVAYAGCGPLGTLIVPLLHLFENQDLNITLIDLHEFSIQSVKKILEQLGGTSINIRTVIGNAVSYQHDKSIDLLITETMYLGLTSEPQVSITQHLVQQLSSEGVLIPEKISLYHNHDFFSKLKIAPASYDEGCAPTDLSQKLHLFSIDRTIKHQPFQYESPEIDFDLDSTSPMDICIYTTIQVYRDIWLQSNEAIITNPHCVRSLNSLGENRSYQLQYSAAPIPSWDVKK